MLWHRRNVALNEEYRLMSSIEKARESWTDIQAWRIENERSLDSQIPKLLAEIRYRFLLQQARKRKYMNRWYLER